MLYSTNPSKLNRGYWKVRGWVWVWYLHSLKITVCERYHFHSIDKTRSFTAKNAIN